MATLTPDSVSDPAAETLAKNAVLTVISRFSIGLIASVVIWQFFEVKNSLREMLQVTNRLEILAARIEERDLARGSTIAEFQQRLKDTEERIRFLLRP